MYFTHPQFSFLSLKPVLGNFSEKGLKNKLVNIFPDSHIVFTDSGRSAFQVAIKDLGLENSTMLVPAYLCDIFLPIFKKYNIKPIYLDINLKTFQPEFYTIEEKITPETKSILICHTYGLPVNLDKITEIARKHNLKIIEDCAHTCPPLAGSANKITGDCAFFSFAKICPNINGGMLVSRFPLETVLPNYRCKLSNIIKFLRLYPLIANLSEKFRKEQSIQDELTEPCKASKLSLKLFNHYLQACEEQITKRIELAKCFQNKLISLGFEVQSYENNNFTYLSALVPKNIDRDELFNKLRKCGIFCSRIWRKPIYNPLNGMLPNTNEAARRIINFPLQNWFTEKDIDRMIEVIRNTASGNRPT